MIRTAARAAPGRCRPPRHRPQPRAPRRGGAILLAAAAALALPACSETASPEARSVRVEIRGLPAPDPSEGHLTLWLFQGASAHEVAVPASGPFEVPVPPGALDSAVVTLEPPGDPDPGPSSYRVLRGAFSGDRAVLDVRGALTNHFPLEREPGAHSLYTTSNNAWAGYPSLENAGMWLFNMFPATNPTGQRWVRLSQLRPEWVYEGWIVHRPGSPDEAWISYGKFRPDHQGFLTSRDHTGSGPFSGDEDFRNSGVEEVPGDEWTTARAGYELPAGLSLPLALDAVDAGGAALWHHVISIEPASDLAEPLGSERPFPIRPYGNPIGAGGPHVPRFIGFREPEPGGTIAPGS